MRKVLPINASKIKYYRLINGITASELARRVNLTRQSISAYEKGIQMPMGDNILNIARVLGVEPKDLVE